MTRRPYRETLTDRSESAEPPRIEAVVVNSGTARIITKTDGGAAVHEGAELSGVSQRTPIVFVVEDDVCARESLELLIANAGLQTETFASAEDLLCRGRVLAPSCLIMGMALPGLDCVDFRKRLALGRKDMPMICVAEYDDVAMTVQAMKAGVFDFLTKPYRDDALLSAIARAIEHSRAIFDQEVEMQRLLDCHSSLSCREREVMALVVSGLPNKRVGFELGISEITVKAHRGQVMRKMKAGSLAGLVKMALKLRA